MFNNLTKEIMIYSLVPAFLIAIVVLLLIICKKKENKTYKFNYIVKVLLMVIIGLVLPLIAGYTIWIYEKFTSKDILSSNILYMILLCFLVIALVILFIINCRKLVKSFKKEELIESE